MARRLSLVLLAVGALVAGVAPAAAGGMCHAGPGSKTKTATDGKVTIAECAFADTVMYVEPGEAVTWSSKDVFPHTVTGAAYEWGSEDVLQSGDEVTYTFEDEGVYPYFCALHPSMVGVVVVGDAAPAGGLDGRGVSEASDALAAPAADDGPPAGGDGGGMTATTGLSIAAAIAASAVGLRLALRRRAGTSPAA